MSDLTFQTDRSEATDNAAVTLAEPGNEKPDMLLKWFYAGNTEGHRFVYSDQEEQQISEYPQQTIIADATAKNSAE